MVKERQATGLDSGTLESAMAKLRELSQESQSAVVSIVERLALVEGVSGHADYKLPTANLELWLTKLRSERKSEKTISL